jgi:hypothetical protein
MFKQIHEGYLISIPTLYIKKIEALHYLMHNIMAQCIIKGIPLMKLEESLS